MKNDLSRRKFLQTGALATGGLLTAANIRLEAHPAYRLTGKVPEALACLCYIWFQ